METTPLNVYVLGEHTLVANGLKHRLMRKFGSAVDVSCFSDCSHCVKKVDYSTHVVVLDASVEGRDFESLARQVRALNPNADVLLHDNSDNILREISGLLRRMLVPEAAAVFAVA